MKRSILRQALCASLIGMSWLLSETTTAAVIRYELSETYGSGLNKPVGSVPWLVVTIADVQSTPTKPWNVELTFSAENLTGSEYVGNWFLNFDEAAGSVGDLVMQVSNASSGAFQNPTISLAHDAYKAGPDGHFDIRLAFASGGGASKRFGADDLLVLGVSHSSSATFNAAAFDAMSLGSGPYGPYHTAAHVRSIVGGESAWVHSVPEPSSSLWALWLALIAVLYRHRSR